MKPCRYISVRAASNLSRAKRVEEAGVERGVPECWTQQTEEDVGAGTDYSNKGTEIAAVSLVSETVDITRRAFAIGKRGRSEAVKR